MSEEICKPFVLHSMDEILLQEAFSILQFQIVAKREIKIFW